MITAIIICMKSISFSIPFTDITITISKKSKVKPVVKQPSFDPSLLANIKLAPDNSIKQSTASLNEFDVFKRISELTYTSQSDS